MNNSDQKTSAKILFTPDPKEKVHQKTIPDGSDLAKNGIVIDVPSIDEHIKKIESADGKIVMQKMEVGNFGLYARVADTEGNVIGIWQNLNC